MKRMIFATAVLATGVLLAACTDSSTSPDPAAKQTFTVTLAVPAGSPSPLAPGVYVVGGGSMPLFTRGQPDRGLGLESLAEDGDPSQLAMIPGAVVFNTPAGDAGPGPATPGKSYRFSFEAAPGERLSFATMYVQSNDAFYAPQDSGIALFSDSVPISGDVTSQIMLWDAGTELNQRPGVGSSQPLRQAGPNTGRSERSTIEPISLRDSYSYGDALRVTIEVM